jgi:glycerol kinase
MANASQTLLLALDQGTHASRALVFDAQGRLKARAYAEVKLKRISAEFVEQDPDAILASVQNVLDRILHSPAVKGGDLMAAGLATQRSSVLAWDLRNGRALCPVISWQDRRNGALIHNLQNYRHKIKEISGLQLSPHYGASKIRWLLDHSAPVRRALKNGSLAVGPLAAYLIFQLVRNNPFLVDHANGLRTQLLNLGSLTWDPWLLARFGIPPDILPECRPVRHDYGRLKAADVPLTAVNGDQTAALYSLGRPGRRQAIVNIGTGAFVLLPTGNRLVLESALLSGLAGSLKGQREYALEGTVNGAGAALAWAVQQWSLPDPHVHLAGWLKHTGNIPLFINTIGGLGSPWWQSGPEPRLIGDGVAWQKAVAVVESILFMLKVNLERMQSAGQTIRSLRITGGLARVDDLCRRLASLCGLPVYRPQELEATARGIAWQAAGGPDVWPKPGRGRWFKPVEAPALASRYHSFRQLMQAVAHPADGSE